MAVSGSSVRGSHSLAEILSQPEVWRACSESLAHDQSVHKILTKSTGCAEWLFVGCGTSYYLAEAVAASWKVLTGKTAHALPASELLLFPQLAQLHVNKLQAVVISRSGQTSEAVRAAELLTRQFHLDTLGVTCAQDSELRKICAQTIALPQADERSVVMTRSFSTMLLALLHLASSDDRPGGYSSIVDRLAVALASRIRLFSERLESFVGRHTFADYIFLGQGPFYPIAREAALKITEMSYSYAQAYHTLEFRHGPKSIAAPETSINFFLSESGRQAESEVLAEMKELGATILAVCNRASDLVRDNCDLVFEIEAEVPELALAAPFIVPAQLLGLHTGIVKGFNPDEPRNLTRVVILD